ncbi:MAG: helix-turn-helix transcriptional regulator [Bacteroidaceae bacterium]|nr:helix-turn-helix domain-containing protein [Bacteroidaceae bacterium]
MNFKDLRKRKGLSQMKAASKCDVSLTTWILWEKSVSTPTDENMEKVKRLERLPDKRG